MSDLTPRDLVSLNDLPELGWDGSLESRECDVHVGPEGVHLESAEHAFDPSENVGRETLYGCLTEIVRLRLSNLLAAVRLALCDDEVALWDASGMATDGQRLKSESKRISRLRAQVEQALSEAVADDRS